MLPKISIITVVRNDQGGLERTLSNLESLAYPNLELIVIDGASTDSTMEVARAHSCSISYLVSEPDGGLYDAMNKGIRASTGHYLWFINAGDTVFCNGEQLVRTILKADSLHGLENCAVLFGDTIIVDTSGEIMGLRGKKLPKKLTFRSLRRGMVVCHQSILVSRSLAPMYDLRYRYASDIEWVIESLERAEKASLVVYNTDLVLSKFETGGISTAHRKAGLRERWAIMRRHYGLGATLWAHVLILAEAFFKPSYRSATSILSSEQES